eukprot:m.241583 g.241583  ORF g.241583 m.241583 type:complete len:332 (+) comp13874_c0_seq1:308-1303(+)
MSWRAWAAGMCSGKWASTAWHCRQSSTTGASTSRTRCVGMSSLARRISAWPSPSLMRAAMSPVSRRRRGAKATCSSSTAPRSGSRAGPWATSSQLPCARGARAWPASACCCWSATCRVFQSARWRHNSTVRTARHSSTWTTCASRLRISSARRTWASCCCSTTSTTSASSSQPLHRGARAFATRRQSSFPWIATHLAAPSRLTRSSATSWPRWPARSRPSTTTSSASPTSFHRASPTSSSAASARSSRCKRARLSSTARARPRKFLAGAASFARGVAASSSGCIATSARPPSRAARRRFCWTLPCASALAGAGSCSRQSCSPAARVSAGML